MASQVDGMEAWIVSLQSKMRQESDGIHSTVQQLNPKEIVVGMAKLTHLESTVSSLDEGIRKIKHLLIMMGKTPTSSSAPLNESSPHEATSRRPLGEQGKPYHATPQHMGEKTPSTSP